MPFPRPGTGVAPPFSSTAGAMRQGCVGAMREGRFVGRILRRGGLVGLLCLLAGPATADFLTHSTTPDIYRITLRSVALEGPSGPVPLLTFGGAGQAFDIAAVGSNQAVEAIPFRHSVPPGAYTAVLVTLGDRIEAAGARAGVGVHRCHTLSGGSANRTVGGLNNIAEAAVDPTAPAETQEIPLPTGAAADAVLSGHGITRTADGLQWRLAMPITIAADGSGLPDLSLKVDVADALQFQPSGFSACVTTVRVPRLSMTR